MTKTRAQRSARHSGAVGPRAIVPRYVLATRPPGPILDFGCGPKAIHTKMLREAGLDVVPYDISIPEGHALYDGRLKLCDHFNTVFASNVINVLESNDDLADVLYQVTCKLKDNGRFICNFPKEPRYCDVITEELLIWALKATFHSVSFVGRGDFKGHNIWRCEQPRRR